MYKKLTMILCVVMLTAQTMSFSAINNETYSKLSISDAVELTVKKSYKLKESDLERIKLGKQIDRLKINIIDIVHRDDVGITEKKDSSDPLVTNISALQSSLIEMSDSEILQRETLASTVETLFVTIQKIETEKKMMDINIEMSDDVQTQNRQRYKLGLISKMSLETSFNNHQKMIRQRDSLSSSINKLYISLKELTDLKVNHSIELDGSGLSMFQIVDLGMDYGVDYETSNLKLKAYNNALNNAKNNYVNSKDLYTAGSQGISDANLELEKAEIKVETEIKNVAYKYQQALLNVHEQYGVVQQKENHLKLSSNDYYVAGVKNKQGILSNQELKEIGNKLEVAKLELLIAKYDYIISRLNLNATIKGTN